MKLIEKTKSVIDHTTMYRSALYLLIALAAWSLVLAFIDVLDFNPLSMVSNLVILVGVGFAVDRLFAYMFGTHPNKESIYISALILYFLFSPSGTPQSFVLMAIIATLAAASKYLLAWRGRHIFNPAATAAVIAGLVGLGQASWWVATPWMLPLVLIHGVMLAYKTRRTDMVLWHIGITYVVSAFVAMIHGTFSLSLLWTILASYPIIFLACFMLTEPLTLAPKRMQRIIIATGIALLAYGQLSIAGVLVSPEIALLIGNLAAFIIGKKRGIILTLKGRRPLAGNQVEYVFEASRRLRFEAGQYIELHIPHTGSDMRGMRRMFTLASRSNARKLRIITRHDQPSSTYKKTLLKLPVGSKVRATGIYGDFTLPTDPSRKVLLLAGGVGVTPFIAFNEELRRRDETRDVTLIYAIKDSREDLHAEYFEDGPIRTVVHVGELSAEVIAKYVDDLSQREVYISGPPAMVRSVSRQLGPYHPVSIHRDFFAGY
jgi:ferredoxin-NADP reductase